ncbi:histone H1-like [Nilaparvata lugens]|uniref:histone H1-like n=1 Tax=Nilaparvata lugens TaxID=108931 RepID=UPI00193D6326|nr:histone H1-like [Nilaparvata lugens]
MNLEAIESKLASAAAIPLLSTLLLNNKMSAETATSPAATVPAASTPAKAKKAAASKAAASSKKPRAKPAHPPTGEMVNAAIAGLKERGGSSLQAIKKYIAANYKADAEKLAPFIKKYLKTAVASGALTQPKGKGVTAMDVVYALKRQGRTLYGFGG